MKLDLFTKHALFHYLLTSHLLCLHSGSVVFVSNTQLQKNLHLDSKDDHYDNFPHHHDLHALQEQLKLQ